MNNQLFSLAMPHEIVLASGNTGKINEFTQLFASLSVSVTVTPQASLGIEDAEETGITFVENALLKARKAAKESGLPAIADDSGICVDALDGAPGVYSARFAGNNKSDMANTEKLLAELKDIPDVMRTAHFHCTLVYLRYANDPSPLICQGVWPGKILYAPKGNKGFGYDPVFYVPEQGCSAAELPEELKNRLSHRAKAMALFKKHLFI